MNLKFTQNAQKDLIRLREFIASKNPSAATRIGQRLKQTIMGLSKQPDMGVNVDDLPGVQDLVTGDYIVRYIVLEQTVVILRIWHGTENITR